MDRMAQNLTTAEQVRGAFDYLKNAVPSALREPKIAIVCGSGLGGLVEAIHDSPRHEISYGDIPCFPKSTGWYNPFVELQHDGFVKFNYRF